MPLCLIYAVCALAMCLSALSGEEHASIAFIQRNCLECHDRETAKGDTILEGFERKLSDPANAGAWERIYDQVESGRMPPAKKAQPEPGERRDFLLDLAGQLNRASRAHQRSEGRVPLRRLSNNAYEQTVRRLLKTETALTGFFPTEVAKAGFDTVADGQGSSAALFIAYQEAADRALDDAAAEEKYTALTYKETLRTGAQLLSQKGDEFLHYGCWVKDAALVVPSQMGFPYTTILLPAAPRNGRYRVTFTGQSLQNDGQPLSIAVSIHNRLSIPWSPVAIDWHDVPADQPKTVTAEYVLEQGDQVHLYGWTLTHRNHVQDEVKKNSKDPGWHWPGPSFALSNLAIEGPLTENGTVDSWPPESYRVLFDRLSPCAGVGPGGKAGCWIPASSQPLADAQRLLRRFMASAFRRPLSEEEERPYLQRVTADLDRGVAFPSAMRTAYKSVLCSPRMIFFAESPGRSRRRGDRGPDGLFPLVLAARCRAAARRGSGRTR